jgi:hypothetical protein
MRARRRVLRGGPVKAPDWKTQVPSRNPHSTQGARFTSGLYSSGGRTQRANDTLRPPPALLIVGQGVKQLRPADKDRDRVVYTL